MRKLLVFGLILCAVAGTVAVSAQSLGEVARREEERRKTVKSAGKVYTNGSLRPDPSSTPKAAVPPSSSAPAPAGPAASGAASPGPASTGSSTASSTAPDHAAGLSTTQAEATTRDESYWRKRITAERDALSRAQTFAEAMQSRINVLANDFSSRDDPAQRGVIAADRQRALAELDRLRLEIQQHGKAIADIQEQARRAGVPAGWVR